MSGWKETTLGEIVDFNSKSYSKKFLWSDFLYLDTGNITRNSIAEIQHYGRTEELPSRARRLVSPNSIVYSTVRPNQQHYGLLRNPPDNMLVSTGFAVLDARGEKADAAFVYYWLTRDEVTDYLQGVGEQSVSTYPTINASDIATLSIVLPPLSTQRRIAAVLSALDDKIELNNRINANLEAQAQALFRSWFVDFEPWEGTMPEGWREGKLRDVVSSMLNGDWGKEISIDTNDSPVYCIRGADIPSVSHGDKGKMPLRYILSKNFAKKRLSNGDVVVEISGGSPTQSTGRAALITDALLNRYDQRMVCTNFCKAVKPSMEYSAFFYYWWRYLYGNGLFFQYENGTTGIKNLDIVAVLEDVGVAIPPQDVLKKFNTIIGALTNAIFANGHESETLSSLRDTLLPKLMSGEIDVSQVEIPA